MLPITREHAVRYTSSTLLTLQQPVRVTMANITLVIGGARSGKSSYASRLALSACDAPVYA